MDDGFNTRYLASQAIRLGGRVLDFGCGRANVVRLLRDADVDARGADVFFGGMDWESDGPHDLLAAGTVRTIVDGHIPFDDGSFDTIVSDQVIEHVDDLDTAVREMGRVLALHGRMYHQYPTLEVIREAHTGLPWVHRLPLRARIPYVRMARAASVRLGHREAEQGASLEWATYISPWIDEYCRYRSRREIEGTFARHGFRIEHREQAYCRTRAENRRLIGLMVDRFPALAQYSFQRLGFDCIEVVRS